MRTPDDIPFIEDPSMRRTNYKLYWMLLILTLPACATSQTRVALTIRNGEPEISITTFPPPQIVTREAIGLGTTHATQSAQIAAQ